MMEYYSIGYEVSYRGGRLVARGTGGEASFPPGEAVVFAGKYRVHTSLFEFLEGFGGTVSFRRYFEVYRFEWPGGAPSRLVSSQLDALATGRFLDYAREFVSASKSNKVWLLSILEGEGFDVGSEREYISGIDLDEPDSLDSLRAYEATIHRVFYDALRKVVPARYGFMERTRRPPRDPFSAALSYGNMVLYGYVKASLRALGFDTRIGFLHVPFRDRDSLAYDLAEEFRQPVVESAILPLFTGGALKRHHFRKEGVAVYLSKRGRGVVGEVLRKRLSSRIGGRSLLEHIWAQSERLARSLLGSGGYEGFRVYRYL